jgi:hypothetical protein
MTQENGKPNRKKKRLPASIRKYLANKPKWETEVTPFGIITYAPAEEEHRGEEAKKEAEGRSDA